MAHAPSFSDIGLSSVWNKILRDEFKIQSPTDIQRTLIPELLVYCTPHTIINKYLCMMNVNDCMINNEYLQMKCSMVSTHQIEHGPDLFVQSCTGSGKTLGITIIFYIYF